MASLGNIGKADPISPGSFAFSAFGRNSPAAVTIHLTGVLPLTNIFLISEAGAVVDTNAADDSGEGYFYDMDDGYYTIYSAGTGDVWEATVTAPTVVINKLFTRNRTIATAFTG